MLIAAVPDPARCDGLTGVSDLGMPAAKSPKTRNVYIIEDGAYVLMD